MDLGLDKTKLDKYKALLVKYLGEPVRLRLAVMLALVGVAAGAGYLPLSHRIEQQRRDLDAEVNRAELIRQVESFRKQIEGYQDRLSAKSDTNEWVKFVLGGLRQTQVKLRDMESKEPVKVGPYRAVVLTVEANGTYPQLKRFLEWLEMSPRLLRVDSVRFEKRADEVIMRVMILGLMKGDAAKTG